MTQRGDGLKKSTAFFNHKRRWILTLAGVVQSIAMLLKKKAALNIIAINLLSSLIRTGASYSREGTVSSGRIVFSVFCGNVDRKRKSMV